MRKGIPGNSILRGDHYGYVEGYLMKCAIYKKVLTVYGE